MKTIWRASSYPAIKLISHICIYEGGYNINITFIINVGMKLIYIFHVWSWYAQLIWSRANKKPLTRSYLPLHMPLDNRGMKYIMWNIDIKCFIMTFIGIECRDQCPPVWWAWGLCPHIGTFAPFAASAEGKKNGLLFLRALSQNCLPSHAEVVSVWPYACTR